MSRRTALLAALALAGCIPEYQTARTLPRGQTRVTGAISNIHSLDQFSDGSFDAVDLAVSHGVSDAGEVGGRYVSFAGTHTLLLGGKAALSRDRLAVSGMIGPAWNSDDYGGLVGVPALLWSVPASPNVELTGAVKVMLVIPDEGDSDIYPGADIGLRLSTDPASWAFQPSIGLLHASENGDSETLLSFGAALSFTR